MNATAFIEFHTGLLGETDRPRHSAVLDYWNTRLAPRLFSGDDPTPKVFVAAAGIVEMAGWMAHDAGRDDRAHRQFRRALDLSTLGGDRQLTIHIHAGHAHLHRHGGEPGTAIRQAYDGEMTIAAVSIPSGPHRRPGRTRPLSCQ